MNSNREQRDRHPSLSPDLDPSPDTGSSPGPLAAEAGDAPDSRLPAHPEDSRPEAASEVPVVLDPAHPGSTLHGLAVRYVAVAESVSRGIERAIASSSSKAEVAAWAAGSPFHGHPDADVTIHAVFLEPSVAAEIDALLTPQERAAAILKVEPVLRGKGLAREIARVFDGVAQGIRP